MHDQSAGTLVSSILNFGSLCFSRDLPALKSLASSLLADASLAATQHPYGFLVFRIPYSDQIALRCHVWQVGTRDLQQPVWPIHSHPETVHSAIVAGAITHKTYSVEQVDSSDHVIYSVSYKRECSTLDRTGSYVSAALATSDILPATKTYTLKPNTFHSVHVASMSFACTLAMTERDPNTANQGAVVGSSAFEHDHLEFKRRAVNSATRSSALLELQRQLNAI